MIYRQYVPKYIRKALKAKQLDAPDKALAAGELEILETLYRAHQKGGPDAAQQAWDNLLELSPEKAKLLESKLQNEKVLYHIDDLDEIPPVEWIIPNIIARNSLNEIHGAPNVGKSLFALDLASKIAQTEPVIYVAAESLSGYRSRCNAWIEHNYCKPQHLFLYGQAVNLLDNAQVLAFLEQMRENITPDPALIVVDTLARCMGGGDENSAKDMGKVIENCDLIRNQLGASILLVHHTGKNSAYERGSSALRGACDTMIHIDTDNNIMKIRNVKQKDARLFADMEKAILEVAGSVVIGDVTEEIRNQAQIGKNELDILIIMNTSIFQTSGITHTQIKENTGISGGTLTRSLSALKESGYISQNAKREPYFITPEGQSILKR